MTTQSGGEGKPFSAALLFLCEIEYHMGFVIREWDIDPLRIIFLNRHKMPIHIADMAEIQAIIREEETDGF